MFISIAVRVSTVFITVKGVPAASGSATAPISLAVGEIRLIVSVVSEDGLVSKAYQVGVTRAGSSTSIAISQSNGVIILQYVGTLESATNVNGPYNEVVAPPVPAPSSPRIPISSSVSGNPDGCFPIGK